MRCLLFFVLTAISLHTLNGQYRAENSRLNFFDIDLLRYTAEDKKGNVVVSPASIKSLLSMILEGADGKTASEIRSALRLSPRKDEFREQLNAYLTVLQENSTGVALENANAIFLSDRTKLKKEYEMMLKNVYLTQVYNVNFKDPIVTTDYINKWVYNKTKGLITDIVDGANINPAADMLVTNGLYFKGLWKNAFSPLLTKPKCFYRDNVCEMVPTMELKTELNYAFVDNLRAHAVELSYQGDKYSMILLVPQERDGMQSLIRDLPYMSLPQISELMEDNDIQLFLPKFSIDFSEDMVGALKNMRISSLFSPTANLSGISNSFNPHVSNIFHKVHVSVDEVGTIAASASSAVVVPLIGSQIILRVDRPFVFFIRENKYGLVLFEGKIEEPNSSSEGSSSLSSVTGQRNVNLQRGG